MFKNKTKLLAGTNTIKSEPRIIFSKIACDFLEELSKNLLKNKAFELGWYFQSILVRIYVKNTAPEISTNHEILLEK